MIRRAKFKALKGLLYQNDYTHEDMAKALGKSATYFNARLAGKQSFSIQDVYRICELFQIPLTQIPDYFPKEDMV